MSNSFKPGDVVVLKSGGPAMTVKSVGEDFGGTMSVFTVWFEKSKMENGAFPVETVELA